MAPAIADMLNAAIHARNRKMGLTTPLARRAGWGAAATFDVQKFDAAHRARDTERNNYLHLDYAHYQKLDRRTRNELGRDAAQHLYANNLLARVRYAHNASDVMFRTLEALPPNTPVFWVTLIRSDDKVSIKDAATFNPAGLIGWVHHVLWGASYYGTVEGGFYSNLTVVGAA